MRTFLALVSALILAGCTVEIRFEPQVLDLRVSPAYCADTESELAYAFYLTAPASSLEFRWSDRPDWPSAPPEGRLRLDEFLAPGEVRGRVRVDPYGRILGLVLVQGLAPAGIEVEPGDRWLWVRADGGPWARSGRVQPLRCAP